MPTRALALVDPEPSYDVEVGDDEPTLARSSFSPRPSELPDVATPDDYHFLRAAKALGDRVLVQALSQRDRAVLLVVSAHRGDGRTFVTDTLRTVLEARRASVVTVRGEEAAPARLPQCDVLLVDSPALLRSEEVLHPTWWNVATCALVIVAARRTPMSDLATLGAQLDVHGVTSRTLVWNDAPRVRGRRR